MPRTAVALAFALAAAPAAAQPAPASRGPIVETRPYTAAESRKIGDEAQRKAEARQEAWEARARNATRSICKGC